jgi:hypothetical protein
MNKEELLHYYNDEGRPTGSTLRKKRYKPFIVDLKREFSFLADIDRVTTLHYIICLVEGYDEVPKCKNCGKTPSTAGDSSFREFCSTKCAAHGTKDKKKQTCLEKYGTTHHLQSEKSRQKQKQTNMEKYGVENVSQLSSVRDKVDSTMIDRYGDKNYFNTSDFKTKLKKTSLEKYGVEHFSSSDVVKKKRKESYIKRYGVDHPSKDDSVKSSTKKTNLERYGVEYASQSNEVKERVKDTNQERYGFDSHLSSPDIRKRIESTNLERYGHITPSMNEDVRQKTRNTNKEKYGSIWVSQRFLSEYALGILNDTKRLKEHYDEFDSITEAASDIDVSMSTYARTLKEQNIEIKYPANVMTMGHKQLKEFIEYLGVEEQDISHNDRTVLGNGKEVDIFIKSHGICIEYNGWYWHSDLYKKWKYHQDKTLQSVNNDYKMIHVWEYDWNNPAKREVIKKKIGAMLGKADRVYARKCEFRMIDNDEAKEFYEHNHIQGHKHSLNHYGLVEKDTGELVSVLSVSYKSKKDNIVDISRYATSKSVVGGFSKLLKRMFEDMNPSVVETFCSLDYGTGAMYEKTGFDKVGVTNPNYKYVKYGKTISRQQAMKHRLNDLLENFDPELSEYDNMTNHGFFRVYDAGSIKYVLGNKKPR